MPKPNPLALARARRLRREQTPAEARLWAVLRGHREQGFEFVRQAPVGPYIVDFLCRSHGLVVEVDGGTHSSETELARDARRRARKIRCPPKIR